MYISVELISAFLIGLCIFLLFIIFFAGVVFHGVGYDAGLRDGLKIGGLQKQPPKRDTILKSHFKNQDIFEKER